MRIAAFQQVDRTHFRLVIKNETENMTHYRVASVEDLNGLSDILTFSNGELYTLDKSVDIHDHVKRLNEAQQQRLYSYMKQGGL